jgi:hypothetical protein
MLTINSVASSMKKRRLKLLVTFTKPLKKHSWKFLGVVATAVAAILIFKWILTKNPNSSEIQFEPITPGQNSSVMPHPPTQSIQTTIPSTPSATTPVKAEAVPTQYSPATQKLLLTLDEILSSKNDNDPRLDREFRHLTTESKSALRKKYSTLTKEDRNGRGTIALLIGREITEAQDIQFLKEILNEPPCYSLENCNQETHMPIGAEAHHEMGFQVTLAYPQLSALYWLEKFLTRSPAENSGLPASLLEEARKVIQMSKESPVPLIRRKAEDIERKIAR